MDALSVYIVVDSFDGDRHTGGMAQLFNPTDGRDPLRRACLWGNLMQRLAPYRRLEFRLFAVPVRDERQAQQYVRQTGVKLPW